MKKLFIALLLVSCGKEKIEPVNAQKVYQQIVWFDYWNMDKIEKRYFEFPKPFATPDSIKVKILSDNGQTYDLLDGGWYNWENGFKIWLFREDYYNGGMFDNTDFDDGYMNRGYFILYY